MSDTVRELIVPAQKGRAFRAVKDELVEITDIEGRQVGDLWVIDAADHGRWRREQV
ncbi:DUF1989 domain-containing protein [Streptomyces sp. NPDC051018]|uniref:DUF1989 domain-containing protein n=1 Tax=Streptomyces sp. NPDC051018 TaxID=3365639 RepID=UPI00378EE204